MLAAEVRRPAVALWLAAVAGLAFKWLSPFGDASENAILADALIAAAAAARILELPQRPFRLGLPHAWLAAYVGLVGVSALAATDHRAALKALLIVAELAVLAALTADLARDDGIARLLGRTVLASVALTALLAVIGLVLFYAGDTTSLIGSYGEQFKASGSYARVAAGFATPPLLASWCIAAAAIVGWPPAALPRRWVVLAQIVLVLIAAATLSRGLLGVLVVLTIQWAARAPSRTRSLVAGGFVVGVIALLAVLTIGRLHVDPAHPSDSSYTVPDPGNRHEAAVTAWHTLRKHPLVGKGPGTYPGTNRGQPFRAHLTPLNIAATTGIPAVIAIGGFVVVLWLRRMRPTDIALWSGAVGLALDGLAQDIDHFRHVWLLIGLLMAQSLAGRAPRRAASPPARG